MIAFDEIFREREHGELNFLLITLRSSRDQMNRQHNFRCLFEVIVERFSLTEPF